MVVSFTPERCERCERCERLEQTLNMALLRGQRKHREAVERLGSELRRRSNCRCTDRLDAGDRGRAGAAQGSGLTVHNCQLRDRGRAETRGSRSIGQEDWEADNTRWRGVGRCRLGEVIDTPIT